MLCNYFVYKRRNVRRGIEKHKRGTNKAALSKCRVVGATCAACSFPCLQEQQFHVSDYSSIPYLLNVVQDLTEEMV